MNDLNKEYYVEDLYASQIKIDSRVNSECHFERMYWFLGADEPIWLHSYYNWGKDLFYFKKNFDLLSKNPNHTFFCDEDYLTYFSARALEHEKRILSFDKLKLYLEQDQDYASVETLLWAYTSDRDCEEDLKKDPSSEWVTAFYQFKLKKGFQH